MKQGLFFFILLFSSNSVISQNTTSAYSPVYISDSSLIDEVTIAFDSTLNKIVRVCDTCSLASFSESSTFFSDKKHPIYFFNSLWLGGFAPADFFVFHIIERQPINDSLFIFTLHVYSPESFSYSAILKLGYNYNTEKVFDYFNISRPNLNMLHYKKLTVFYPEYISVKDDHLKFAYQLCDKIADDLNLSDSIIYKQEIKCISGLNSSDYERFFGVILLPAIMEVEPQLGGFTDPNNHILYSGIGLPIHYHELIHLVFNYQMNCNIIITEGIASYYGSIGGKPYLEYYDSLKMFLKNNQVSTLEQLINISGKEYLRIRGNSIIGALIIADVKKRFGKAGVQYLIRHSSTKSEMIETLKKQYSKKSDDIYKLIFKI